MKLTTRGRYGVKALYELALRYGSGPLAVKQIAQGQGLSEHYLEQLVAPLRKAGLIVSARGAQGGYTLGRAPEQVTVGDILRVLEGPLGEGEPEEGAPVWRKVTERLVTLVDHITLADLIEEVRREQDPSALMYHI